VISIDYTIMIQAVNFLFLIFILNLLLYKPIIAILEKRQKELDDSQADINRLNETIEKKMAEYEDKVRQAKVGAIEQKNLILTEASDKGKSIIDAVRAEVPKMFELFSEKLNKEVDDARKILAGQSQKTSRDIAEKVLGRSVQ
jgi:F-type H+-transporting ATPase subunit b